MLMRYSIFTGIIFLISVIPITAQSVVIDAIPHNTSVCSSGFIAHVLDHITSVNADPIRMFESNGSGLAVNDLNQDGFLDIVLANLDGEESILYNAGNLNFRRASLDIPGRTRAVAIVDVDADNLLDITLTTQRGTPIWYRNNGDETFTLTPLSGVRNSAYALSWGDLDLDGDLDLVTGSYDAELSRIMTNDFLFGGGGGIFYYENRDGNFDPTQLAETAQALVVFFTDLNHDNQWEIAVGNDFLELDRFWKLVNGQWIEQAPYEVMTHSTMSMDMGDINNDGFAEFYATDMHPYSTDEGILAQWQPVIDSMTDAPENDPQIMENVLQTLSGNIAADYGVEYTGWSWSSKFGDLDSDGFLDLYVVNGMIAEDLFGHLPNNELVEANQAFRSVNGERFELAPEWELDALESGRGMSMADMDNDGDLDIVVNNLMSPAMLYENQICGGDNLTISLHHPTSQNTQSIGAEITLETNTGTYQRVVRAMSGYLSGDPSQVHFGLPEDSVINSVIIRWSDGVMTQHDQINSNTHLVVTRSH